MIRFCLFTAFAGFTYVLFCFEVIVDKELFIFLNMAKKGEFLYQNQDNQSVCGFW